MRHAIAITLLLLYLGLGKAPAQVKNEVRAVWLTTLSGMDWPQAKSAEAQKQELRDILDRLADMRINTILFQTRIRGDVAYRSAIEGFNDVFKTPSGGTPSYDPLAFVIDECHKRGMECHAWLVAIPLGTAEHVKRQGSKSFVSKHPKSSIKYNGSWYMNPSSSTTRKYLADLAREITRNYDIDGIHLDYIRYPERARNFPDINFYKKARVKSSLPQWRRDNITAVVRAIHAAVKREKPWVKVSCSPVGKYKDLRRYSSRGWNSFHSVHQEAQTWLRMGIMDVLFPMLYYTGQDFYPFAADWAENKEGRLVVPGLGAYRLGKKDGDWKRDVILQETNFCRQIASDGIAYFRARQLTDNTKGIGSALAQGLFSCPALQPPMAWQSRHLPPSPRITNVSMQGGTLSFSWEEAPANDKENNLTYVLYASDVYPVNTNQAENIIDTHLSGGKYKYTAVYDSEKYRYFALTAIDRYGNESAPSAITTPASYPDTKTSVEEIRQLLHDQFRHRTKTGNERHTRPFLRRKAQNNLNTRH